MEWIVFSEETADRARGAIREIDQRIWASLAAVVLLALFIVTQLKQSALAPEQLRAIGKLLVALVLGFMAIGAHLGQGTGIQLSTAEDRGMLRLIRHFVPLMVGEAVVVATTLLIALASTNPQVSSIWAFIGLNGLPLLFLSMLTISSVYVSLTMGRWHQRVTRPTATPAGRTNRLPYVLALCLILLIAARYAVGGLADLLAALPSWISFSEIFGGGAALLAFVVWMGALFSNRNMTAERLDWLEAFHLSVARGDIAPGDAPRAYVEILQTTGPQRATDLANHLRTLRAATEASGHKNDDAEKAA